MCNLKQLLDNQGLGYKVNCTEGDFKDKKDKNWKSEYLGYDKLCGIFSHVAVLEEKNEKRIRTPDFAVVSKDGTIASIEHKTLVLNPDDDKKAISNNSFLGSPNYKNNLKKGLEQLNGTVADRINGKRILMIRVDNRFADPSLNELMRAVLGMVSFDAYIDTPEKPTAHLYAFNAMTESLFNHSDYTLDAVIIYGDYFTLFNSEIILMPNYLSPNYNALIDSGLYDDLVDSGAEPFCPMFYSCIVTGFHFLSEGCITENMLKAKRKDEYDDRIHKASGKIARDIGLKTYRLSPLGDESIFSIRYSGKYSPYLDDDENISNSTASLVKSGINPSIAESIAELAVNNIPKERDKQKTYIE